MEVDERFMRRAIELACLADADASPNPRVGCVIVHNGLIVGEGWHRRCGNPHAEVEAVHSMADPSLLPQCTVYVTLEPCAHYGRTPPCATMLAEHGVSRVVVGSVDPFARVSGRGIEILRESGAEVVVGCLEYECRDINPEFMTAHSLHCAYVRLKWAQSADGFMDHKRDGEESPARFSTPLSSMAVAQMRSRVGIVAVGAGTFLADHPRLNVRLWDGPQPRKLLLDRHGLVSPSSIPEGWIVATSCDNTNTYGSGIDVIAATSPADIARSIYEDFGIISMLVEGGAGVLTDFINNDIWDEVRVEVSPVKLGDKGSCLAPVLPRGVTSFSQLDSNRIITVRAGR